MLVAVEKETAGPVKVSGSRRCPRGVPRVTFATLVLRIRGDRSLRIDPCPLSRASPRGGTARSSSAGDGHAQVVAGVATRLESRRRSRRRCALSTPGANRKALSVNANQVCGEERATDWHALSAYG